MPLCLFSSKNVTWPLVRKCSKMPIYDPKVIFIEPLMGFRHIGHLFNASAHCAHLLNDDENNAIKITIL